jgi:hypothetical protein
MAITSIQFLVSPSVTATNGSTTLNVTGSIDCSKVYSGTVILIAGSQAAEAVSGTIADGNGDSTITLRLPWPEATTTARMVSFNSIEGLTEAIRRAREIVSNIDIADATIQQQLIDIQANLTLIGDAPTYAAQTAQDAIDTAADLVLTSADVVLTHADVVITNADAVSTNNDAIATAADRVQTGLDVVATGNDVTATNADVVLTNADVVLTHADVVLTAQDALDTAADLLLTNADVVSTNADAVATAADRVQTGLDVDSTETARDVSFSNANYKGEWSLLSGALNIPASVKDGDTVYMLNNNLADVTLSQPSLTPADWFVLGSITGVAPDSSKLIGIAGNLFYNSTTKIPSVADISGLVTELSGKSDTGHSHATSDVTGLDTTLSGKSDTGHSHVTGDVTGLDTALSGKSDTGHVHTIANVTGLQAALDAGSQITYNDATTQTFTRQAVNTYINYFSGSAPTYTLDESTFLIGDKVYVTKFYTSIPDITITTTTGGIFNSEGFALPSQTLGVAGTICLEKIDSGNWIARAA